MSDTLALARTRNAAVARRARSAAKAFTADEAQRIVQDELRDDWIAIIRTAKAQAIEGDDKARTFVAERAFGRAPQNVAVTSTVEHHYSGQVNVAVLAAQTALKLKDEKTKGD